MLVLVLWVLVILGRRVILVVVVLVLTLILVVGVMLRPWVKLVLVLVLVLGLVVSLMGWHIGRVRVLVLRVLVLRMLVSSYPVRLVVRVCWATIGILVWVGIGLIWSLILVLILISISLSEILVVPPWCISLLPRNPIAVGIVVSCGICLLHIQRVVQLIIW